MDVTYNIKCAFDQLLAYSLHCSLKHSANACELGALAARCKHPRAGPLINADRIDRFEARMECPLQLRMHARLSQAALSL